jgi:hypothetical protein
VIKCVSVRCGSSTLPGTPSLVLRLIRNCRKLGMSATDPLLWQVHSPDKSKLPFKIPIHQINYILPLTISFLHFYLAISYNGDLSFRTSPKI